MFQGKGRSNAAPMIARAIIVRLVCVVCAIAGLFLALMAGWDLALTGFPDSHFTDYDKAVDAPKRILMWVECALVLVVIVQWVGVPWYFGTHLGLDNGKGG